MTTNYPALHFLSLGAGVQSSTMALMAAHGELTPMPDHAIFADTGAEPRKVYEWLDWLEPQLPFPVHRVMHKDGLQKNIEQSIHGGRFAGAPFYTESAEGKREGMLRRQCTREFKITPIEQKIRQLLGLKKGQRGPKRIAAVIWQGISTDEIQRARKGIEGWQQFRYPLIEMKMSRMQCLEWMQGKGYPMPTKSACIWCPYHDDRAWRDIKENDPESWAVAVQMDDMIRGGVRGTSQKLYLHKSLVPLAEVDFRTPEDFGQIDAFAEECEGMCGI
jgi:hypothetical protein